MRGTGERLGCGNFSGRHQIAATIGPAPGWLCVSIGYSTTGKAGGCKECHGGTLPGKIATPKDYRPMLKIKVSNSITPHACGTAMRTTINTQ